jgi:CBS domain containing-hemolysin-like protein
MLLFEVITIFVKVFTITSKWLHDNLVVYLVNFAKGFELLIIVIAVISFLLFNLFLTMRHLKKLPKYYAIEIVDSYGNKTAVEGLRVIFTTYDAAESYARFYQDIYKTQYKFRVTGLKE